MTNAFASFDTGHSGSQGPWIHWSAQTRGFILRQGSDKVPFTGFEQGVVLDVHTMRTGWQRSEGTAGVAPEWQWNASLSHFEPRPGEDWKQGFHLPCATLDGQTAIWEQAGASAWNGLLNLIPALRRQPAGDVLPRVKLVGVREARFAKGKAVIPLLEVVAWVPRPACLLEGAMGTVSALQSGEAVSQTPPEAAVRAHAVAPINDALDDEIPF